MFTKFDRDGSGAISSRELGDIMRTLGMNPTNQQINKMISDVDNNSKSHVVKKHFQKQHFLKSLLPIGDGTIDFNEFVRLMGRMKNEGSGSKDLMNAFKVKDDKILRA